MRQKVKVSCRHFVAFGLKYSFRCRVEVRLPAGKFESPPKISSSAIRPEVMARSASLLFPPRPLPLTRCFLPRAPAKRLVSLCIFLGIS